MRFVVLFGPSLFLYCWRGMVKLTAAQQDDETATKAGSKSISLVYDRWPEGEDMYHDPSFGFVTSTDDPFAADEGGSSSSSGFWTTTNIIIISIVGSIALLAVVAAIVGGAIFMVHRRRAAYESV